MKKRFVFVKESLTHKVGDMYEFSECRNVYLKVNPMGGLVNSYFLHKNTVENTEFMKSVDFVKTISNNDFEIKNNMTLKKWGLFHQTDKATAHQYCDFYEDRIGEPKRIIEFGVLNGASLKMWRDRYPQALVIGLDIGQKQAPENTFTFKVDASKRNWITDIQPSFDLIIDDASHITLEQVSAFELWWPLVAKGGHYILEDIHTMAYSAYNPTAFDLKSWVESLGIKHEYFWRIPGDESDSGTLIFYK